MCASARAREHCPVFCGTKCVTCCQYEHVARLMYCVTWFGKVFCSQLCSRTRNASLHHALQHITSDAHADAHTHKLVFKLTPHHARLGVHRAPKHNTTYVRSRLPTRVEPPGTRRLRLRSMHRRMASLTGCCFAVETHGKTTKQKRFPSKCGMSLSCSCFHTLHHPRHHVHDC